MASASPRRLTEPSGFWTIWVPMGKSFRKLKGRPEDRPFLSFRRSRCRLRQVRDHARSRLVAGKQAVFADQQLLHAVARLGEILDLDRVEPGELPHVHLENKRRAVALKAVGHDLQIAEV